MYAWPVDRLHLVPSGSQEVAVELEKDVSWDIDYVCVLVSGTSWELRDACKQVVYVILGAVLGTIATVRRLMSRSSEVRRRSDEIPVGDGISHVSHLDERKQVRRVDLPEFQSEVVSDEPFEVPISG